MIDAAAIRAALANRKPNITCPGMSAEPVTLDTDTDTALTYTWWDISPDAHDDGPRDKAHETALLTATTADGERYGYMRIDYTTADYVTAVFPRPLAWFEGNTGHLLGFGAARSGYGDPVTDQSLWLGAVQALGTDALHRADAPTKPYYRLTDADVPTDPDVVRTDLATLEVPIRKNMDAWTRYFSVPFVAWSDSTVARQYGIGGVGQRLYTLAATQLATQGKILRASDLVSDSAKRLWARMAANPDIPTSTIRLTTPSTGTKQTFHCLDYRQLTSPS